MKCLGSDASQIAAHACAKLGEALPVIRLLSIAKKSQIEQNVDFWMQPARLASLLLGLDERTHQGWRARPSPIYTPLGPMNSVFPLLHEGVAQRLSIGAEEVAAQLLCAQWDDHQPGISTVQQGIFESATLPPKHRVFTQGLTIIAQEGAAKLLCSQWINRPPRIYIVQQQQHQVHSSLHAHLKALQAPCSSHNTVCLHDASSLRHLVHAAHASAHLWSAQLDCSVQNIYTSLKHPQSAGIAKGSLLDYSAHKQAVP